MKKGRTGRTSSGGIEYSANSHGAWHTHQTRIEVNKGKDKYKRECTYSKMLMQD
jgi:hypothetical protein